MLLFERHPPQEKSDWKASSDFSCSKRSLQACAWRVLSQIRGFSAGITFATSNKTPVFSFFFYQALLLASLQGENVPRYKRGITRFIRRPLECLVMDNVRALLKITSR